MNAKFQKKTASGEKKRNECENNEIIHNLYERLRWVWAGRGERSEKLYERGKTLTRRKEKGEGEKAPHKRSTSYTIKCQLLKRINLMKT